MISYTYILLLFKLCKTNKGSPFMLTCFEGDGDKEKGPKRVYRSVQQAPRLLFHDDSRKIQNSDVWQGSR